MKRVIEDIEREWVLDPKERWQGQQDAAATSAVHYVVEIPKRHD